LSLYPHYLRNNTFFWICLATLPLSMQSSVREKGNYVFWFALAVGGLSMLLPTTIGIYLVLCLTLIFLVQSIVGRLEYTLIAHALLASPLFTYFSSLVSFPLRLQLSSIVTFLLQTIGMDIQIEGNMVYLGDTSFLVDEACAGMFMLGYGLLFGTIILSQSYKKKVLSLKLLILYYAILLILIFSANIVRITLLIIFNIMPDHWLHEVLGIFLYAFQILLPFYLIVQFVTNPLVSQDEKKERLTPIFPWKKYALLCCLMGLLIAREHTNKKWHEMTERKIDFPGFESKMIKDNVVKLQNDNSLIYVKPPVSPYRADHNPMICWQGSGYSFKKIEKWPIENMTINHAELVKGDDKVYTAWWFQSENHKTGNQLEWRKFGLLHNEEFYLINLTCSTKKELANQLNIIMAQNIISKKLKSQSNEI